MKEISKFEPGVIVVAPYSAGMCRLLPIAKLLDYKAARDRNWRCELLRSPDSLRRGCPKDIRTQIMFYNEEDMTILFETPQEDRRLSLETILSKYWPEIMDKLLSYLYVLQEIKKTVSRSL